MILFCTCSFSKHLDEELLLKLIKASGDAEMEYEVVDDLCRIADKEPEKLKKMDGSTIVACYPRAVKSLLDKAGVAPKKVINVRKNINEEGDTEARQGKAASSLGLKLGSSVAEGSLPAPEGDWIPWYPVIDYDRCIACGRCMDYCLFGVYVIDEGKVKVENADHCKNNCPACSRVCPEKAIIFPKYPKSFINGGLIDEEPSVDIEELMKKRDLYKQLQARNQNRNKLV